jgi:hypothetical protein
MAFKKQTALPAWCGKGGANQERISPFIGKARAGSPETGERDTLLPRTIPKQKPGSLLSRVAV